MTGRHLQGAAGLAATGSEESPGADRRQRRDVRLVIAAIALGLVLQALVFGLIYPNLWYGLHEATDIDRHQARATLIVSGEIPYRDFAFEYPPLAIPLLLAPGHTGASADRLHGYQRWFAVEMFALALGVSALTTFAAWRLWRRPARAFQAAAAGALFTAALGPIVENRFDVAVALFVVLTLLALTGGRTRGAGVLVGLGGALKTAPLVLLPLVLALSVGRRRRLWAAGAAALALLLPYLPFVVMSPGGVRDSFAYHGDRPLQIESTLATPLLLRHLASSDVATVRYTYGSDNLHAAGAALLVALAPLLTLAALAAVWWLTWRARSLLAASPCKLPLALLAPLLAFMVFNKVASPQYYVWLLPVAVLVLLDDRPLGLLLLVVTAVTQVEFPSLYRSLVHLESIGIAVVTLRNLLLVAAFVLALVRLWRLGGHPGVVGSSAGAGSSPQPAPPGP